MLQDEAGLGGESPPIFFELPVNNTREAIIDNIRANRARGLPELTQHEFCDTPLMVIAGGPSLHDFMPVIDAFRPDCHVLSLNGAYKFLRERGIESDHFLMLDSRAENIVHADSPGAATNHCLASQVHPVVFDALHDHQVTMFHLGTQTALDAMAGEHFNFVFGPIGMASVYAISVAAALGYRKIMLFGYDFSHAEKGYAYPQPLNEDDYTIEIPLNGKKFKTTLALARTAEQFTKAIGPVMRACGLEIQLYSEGLLSEMMAVANSSRPVEDKEREKYEAMWKFDTYRVVAPGLRYVEQAAASLRMERGASIADLGCGTGRCAKWFTDHGFHGIGVDIAANALEESVPFHQAALWDAAALPRVDYGFSCDVLEHIPTEKVDDTLRAMHEVVSVGCYLNIDTIPDSFGVFIGQTLHMTVKPAEWWEEKLSALWPSVERLLTGDEKEDAKQAVFVVRK